MYFGSLPLDQAEGAYLAHSLRIASGRISKGRLLDRALLDELARQGVEQVVVARLEAGDTHEDAAADRVARALAGPGVRISDPAGGRVNLQASVTGLCGFDAGALVAANGVDEGITMATVPTDSWVLAGRTVATIKIIPYAVADARLEQVLERLADTRIAVCAPVPQSAWLIQTRLSSLRETVLDKTHQVTRQRLEQRQARLMGESRCAHTQSALVDALQSALQQAPDWILLAGASAISDRRDVIPSAIEAVGGTVLRYGIPVDPGNLLLLGSIGERTVMGLPGCARSPKDNGFDRVLDRLACRQSVTSDWLDGLAIGGLLSDITERPRPRRRRGANRRVAALLLAAGTSTRAGPRNKLLHVWQQRPLIDWTVSAIRHSRAAHLLAVTGHDHEAVEAVLRRQDVECVHNPAYASGMAGSLARGISALVDYDAVIVCLADMPQVSSAVIDHLIDAFAGTEDRDIFIPVHAGRRGNPVLIAKEFFDALLQLEGDVGARDLVRDHPQRVQEVVVDSKGILQDYDTPDALRQLDGMMPGLPGR